MSRECDEFIECWYCQTSNVAAERSDCRECGADLIPPTAEERRWKAVAETMENFERSLRNRTDEQKRAGAELMRGVARYVAEFPESDPFRTFFFEVYPELA